MVYLAASKDRAVAEPLLPMLMPAMVTLFLLTLKKPMRIPP